MSRKSIYLASQKKSEYRQNFLPFDYYDFCITAKENENLRCRNKLRDYMHTPFDWDEDLDIYIEPVSDNFNQATQTSERPSHTKAKKQQPKTFNELKAHENAVNSALESNRIIRDRYLNNYDEKYIEELRADAVKETRKLKKNNKKNKTKQTVDAAERSDNDFKKNGIQITARPRSGSRQQPPKVPLKRAQSALIKNSTIKSNTPSAALAKEIQAKKTGNYELLKNSANQAIQTPQDWNLRQYKRPASRGGLYRSASAVSVKSKQDNNEKNTKPAPFAMYGSGVKTKDMSFKPTHNSLANRTLARNHGDRDAMMELALQNLKKQANLMANEYSVLESASADKFRNERSESRGWNSEYEERYPDYSRSASREELYFKERPYGLSKSTLNVDYPVLKRGSNAGAKKIYFYE